MKKLLPSKNSFRYDIHTREEWLTGAFINGPIMFPTLTVGTMINVRSFALVSASGRGVFTHKSVLLSDAQAYVFEVEPDSDDNHMSYAQVTGVFAHETQSDSLDFLELNVEAWDDAEGKGCIVRCRMFNDPLHGFWLPLRVTVTAALYEDSARAWVHYLNDSAKLATMARTAYSRKEQKVPWWR